MAATNLYRCSRWLMQFYMMKNAVPTVVQQNDASKESSTHLRSVCLHIPLACARSPSAAATGSEPGKLAN